MWLVRLIFFFGLKLLYNRFLPQFWGLKLKVFLNSETWRLRSIVDCRFVLFLGLASGWLTWLLLVLKLSLVLVEVKFEVSLVDIRIG